MKRPGIGGQLTAWYSLILALSLAAFCTVVYFAVVYSIRQTAQAELTERTNSVRTVLEAHVNRGRVAVQHELAEFAVGLGLVDRMRVTDAYGIIYASPGLENPVQPPHPFQRRPWRQWIDGQPFLFQHQTIQIAGAPYDLTMAVAVGPFYRTLTRASSLLFITAPLFLALASLGGYWLSRRALRPVDEITQAARSIGVQDLAKRIAVPPTRDELARLAETLNEMLARLDSAFHKITQFTADASHELRTPVAVMRTSAEITLRKPRTESEYRDTLLQILNETDKVSQLIENLLALARADSGAAHLQMKHSDVGSILNGACEKSKLLAEAKGVALSRNAAKTSLWVLADPDSIERLFLILLDNAVRYTPGGGSIDVKLATDDGFAVAEIRDTGIGISAEDMPHIFDRFYRADRARTREPGGAGLGLAIGQWIAQAHGGEIRVESESARGAIFKVRLPLSQN